MSFENERKRRMDEILELLRLNPEGLTMQTLARDTKMVTEITRQRMELYIKELEWCGIVITKRDGRIKLK